YGWTGTATTPSGSRPTCPATTRWARSSTPPWSRIPGTRRRSSRAAGAPGREAHPGHEREAKQVRRYGGMVSFRAAGGPEQAIEICNRTKLFVLAESLGGVESLIEHPGQMTHLSAAGSALEVPADLVRLSVGIETIDDLLADLEQALDGADP